METAALPFRELDHIDDVHVERDVPMSTLTAFRIGGPARIILAPRSLGGIERCLHVLDRQGIGFHILGRGSNLLVSDSGIDVVLSLAGFSFIEFNEFTGERKSADKTHIVTAGAGCGLGKLISWCTAKGLGGLEMLAGIPGSTGGALFMNAGASGVSFGDLVHEVLVSSARGSAWFSREKLKFEYRKTVLPENGVVTAVRLRFRPVPAQEQRRSVAGVMRRRIASQPLGQASAGCIFRNFDDVSAGLLIDRCGLKGYRVGGAVVSPLHANFIVNTGGAACGHVTCLMEEVKAKVLRETGRILRSEVKVWQ